MNDGNIYNLTAKQMLVRAIEHKSGFITMFTPEHRNYEEGGAFAVSHIFPALEAGGVTYIQIDPCPQFQTAIKGIVVKASQTIRVQLFENPTLVSGSTEILAIQRDRSKVSLLTCGTKYYNDPTSITNEGTLLKTELFGSGNTSFDSTAFVDEEGFNLNKDMQYLYKFTNIDNNQASIFTMTQRLYLVGIRL